MADKAHEGANRWTDNVFMLQKWCEKSMDPGELKSGFKQLGYVSCLGLARVVLGAIEGDALGECVGPALGASEGAADGATLADSLGASDGIMVRKVPPNVGVCRQELVKLSPPASCRATHGSNHRASLASCERTAAQVQLGHVGLPGLARSNGANEHCRYVHTDVQS
jgi:hypothetical protein